MWVVVVGVLVISAGRPAGAQSVASASATVTVPALVQVRSVSTMTTRRLDARLIEVTQRVVAAANTSYSMTVQPTVSVAADNGQSSRVLVRSIDGAFVPLDADGRVFVATGERGPESITYVVFRIDGAGVTPDSALARVVFRPVSSAR